MILFTNYILSTVLEKKLSQQHLPHQQAYLRQLFIQYWLPVHGRFMMTEIQWQAQFLLILLNQLHLEEKLNQPLIIKLHYFNPLNFWLLLTIYTSHLGNLVCANLYENKRVTRKNCLITSRQHVNKNHCFKSQFDCLMLKNRPGILTNTVCKGTNVKAYNSKLWFSLNFAIILVDYHTFHNIMKVSPT